ncbi:deoxycytidylate deaminase [Alcanivorax profundi]|uniref:Deoxycytidylate deaminase n=1 Tax=Alcanivorax profundi TaxID=2338368 RepID=A0A418XX41_9GAMM|nr:anti-phage dCTP deaminase [Alcanivorax profundi]RJG17372.1 deoxycytidylate deaminase [Alcanivorax profundi]
MEFNTSIDEIFLARKKFMIVGLTGRTGSGCTTAAKIFEEKKGRQYFPGLADVATEGAPFFEGLDSRRYQILRDYAEKNWSGFISIKVSDLISAYIMRMSKSKVVDFIYGVRNKDEIKKEDIKRCVNKVVEIRNSLIRKHQHIIDMLIDPGVDLDLSEINERRFLMVLLSVRRFTRDLKKHLTGIDEGLYVAAYQGAGNSLRKVGEIDLDYKSKDFNRDAIFTLPNAINRIIKCLRELKDNCYIVIDAIRNPYEARFFKDRYAAFYLVSINAPDSARSKYLHEVHKFDPDQLNVLDQTESGKIITDSGVRQPNEWGEKLTVTDVRKCLQFSDIHIYNPRSELSNTNVLRAQIFWYFSLMVHPGLVSPTSIERVMQIAFTAKLNSGCISRQVGAVVTGNDYSIRSVGWNDVPASQVPCALRSVEGALSGFDPVVYSEYERNNDKFRDVLEKRNRILIKNIKEMKGRPVSYCFKDTENTLRGDKNQVHTRSLHAEENAFLQITKYGGASVMGGKLFSTASPCELCSKKAMQLGIKDIYFIDPYPGISKDHVLANGSDKPNLVQFFGAVGTGYQRLYEPLMPYKDELDYLSNSE